nr:hypothetical protein [Tanacetum cinerariifolium]
MEECHLLLTDHIDLINLEGNRVMHDVSKPLPLGGPPGQVKSQVKAQVTRILPRIEEAVNAQLEVEVLTRSSHSSRTSYAVAADLSEMELKKILIEKMEGNKREDDDQEGPSAGLDWGSKRPREEGAHASDSTPSKPATGSAGRTTTGSQSRQLSASEFAFAEEPVKPTCQMKEPSHLVFETEYTIVHKPRAIVYRDRNNQKKMLQKTEVHMFSDGTLGRILEKLDYMVKDYELHMSNPGMENRIWNKDDKRRS